MQSNQEEGDIGSHDEYHECVLKTDSNTIGDDGDADKLHTTIFQVNDDATTTNKNNDAGSLLRSQSCHKSMRDSGVVVDDKDGKLYKRMMNNQWSKRLLLRFPGCCVFLIGVILPMFLLMLMALFFGLCLAALEAPHEVEVNDDTCARIFLANRTEQSIVSLTTEFPRICSEAYLLETELSPFEPILDSVLVNATTFVENNTNAIEGFSDRTTNFLELYDYLDACGEAGRTWTMDRFRELEEAVVEIGVSGLTFNWIRCYSGGNDLDVDLRNDLLRLNEVHPTQQYYYYTSRWREDYYRLVEEYQQQIRKSGQLSVEEIFEASNRALEDATGGDVCTLNGSGSAWFWFTVETTVGYGNQAPITLAGRSLVFTAGFLSILVFGAMLSRSGRVIADLMDQMMLKTHPSMERFAYPGWGAVYWGVLWAFWMWVIAAVTTRWKKVRLNEDLGVGEAYWFSFITTTTVGLGDIFLEPDVMLGIDLLYFPIIFLVGFNLLSAFLNKVTDFLVDYLRSEKRSLVDSILAMSIDNADDQLECAPQTDKEQHKEEDDIVVLT